MQVRSGEQFAVTLADLPGAGYSWTAREVPAGLVALGAEWAEGEPAGVGAARGRAFRFRAERPGSYTLVMDLVRPWEGPEATPAQRHTVEVVVEP